MTESSCSKCGARLVGNTAGGETCPECLLRLGLDAAGGDESQATTASESGEPLPSEGRIGPYRLLQKIGEGGMGEVYEAEQTDPVRRRVALKVIKHGMDTGQIVARFEAERQALAVMDHPAVAKVFDGGATPRGRPYFVMELVQGVPITQHCDRLRLTTSERLELFVQVCEGVQHAHQNAIIHRDLKPSNVLVTARDGKAEPKIIDFGVAKATAQKLTERTLFTELGVLIGTPEYMSPEQAEMTGQNVDTRTDVYALGVMLYELLVGALPFDSNELREAGFEAIVRRIREDEPPKPSTRLSSLGDGSIESAKCRRVDPATLQRQLRGDLDWITMKTLEKDRARRYGSPQELAADIGRYLSNEPVLATPPSAAYRAGKFVRRHRMGVGVAAAGVLVLAAFAGTMAVQASRIAREAETSERVSEFLADMLGGVDPQVMGLALRKDQRERVAEARRTRGATEDEIAAVLTSFDGVLSEVNPTDVALHLVDEQILSRAAETIEQELAEEPRIAGQLEHTIGATYRKLGLHDQAERHAKRALEVRERDLGPNHPSLLTSMHSLASVYWYQGRYDEAESLHLETLEARKRVLGNDHPDTLSSMHSLGLLYSSQGRYDEAEPLHVETLEAMQRVLGNDHPDTLNARNNLANVYWFRARYDEAEPIYLETLEARKRVLGEDHRDTLTSMQNLASVYLKQDRYDEAEPLLLHALERKRAVLGNDHERTLMSMNNLANLYGSQGRYDEAIPLLLETLETQKRVMGEEHISTAITKLNLACGYRDTGRYAEARRLFERVQRFCEDNLQPEHAFALANREEYDKLLSEVGKDEERANPAD